MSRLPPEAAAFVRHLGIGYLDDLICLAAYLNGVVENDPGFA